MSSRLRDAEAVEAVAPRLGERAVRIRRVVDPLVFALLFVVAWQVFIWITGFHSVVLPPPSKVLNVLVHQGDFLVRNMLTTMITIGWGFFLGGVFGFVAGVLSHHFERVKRAVHPILVALYVIPKAVFIPLFILWWGVGFQYKLVVTLLLAFFPVTENTITGLTGVERGDGRTHPISSGKQMVRFSQGVLALRPALCAGRVAHRPYRVVHRRGAQ